MGYVGNEPFFGFIKSEEHISVGGAQYTLGRVAPSKDSIQVTVNGVVKRPSEYTLSGVILTLAGVPVDDVVFVRYLTTTGTHATYTQNQLADNIVTSSKIIDGAVTNDHIVSMAASKITGGFGGTFHQDLFVSDGTTPIFTLTQDVVVAASIIVTVSGIHQFSPNHYTLSGTGNRTLTFNTTPADTLIVTIQYLGIVTDIGVPSGGTLTPSMFAPGTIPVKYSTNPTVTSAEDNTYSIGTEWINTTDGNIFVLTDDTVGANVWLGMSQRFDTLGALAGGQRGAVITYDANGNWVVLAPGNPGQVLTSGGFAKNAEWVGGWTEAVNNTTSTEIVTVASSKFVINGVSQPALTLYEGNTYKFDTSNASNVGHHFKFSTTADGTHGSGVDYTTGVTYNGIPGSAGAYTQIVVAANAPELYYWCHHHASMGGTASTSASIPVDTGKSYLVDTSSNDISVVLPSSPLPGADIRFVDKTGTFGVNKFTIERNGKKIERMDYDLVLEGGPHMELVYTSAADGWIRTDTDGADWKHITTADGVITLSYEASAYNFNPTGITPTTNLIISSGTFPTLTDGNHANAAAANAVTWDANTIDATKYMQWQWETPQIITEVRIYNNELDSNPETAILTVTSTAEAFTVGETITGVTSGATGTVILGDANTTTVTYTETGSVRFVAENITGGTSGFTKVVSAVATPHGMWQWQGSATGAWGGEEVDIGAKWKLHNTGLTGGAGGYNDYTELSANTTGYKYYRIQGVSGHTTTTSWWLEFYFQTQNGVYSVPVYDTYCNSSYFVDTTAGEFTAKLPTYPAINDYIDFADQTSQFATNKLTLDRNNKNIQTLGEDLELNVANSSTRLTYTGTTNGWVLS
jgi:hypothetical protein